MKPLLLILVLLFGMTSFSQTSGEETLYSNRENSRSSGYTSKNSSQEVKMLPWTSKETPIGNQNEEELQAQTIRESMVYFENAIRNAWKTYQTTGEDTPLENAFTLAEEYRYGNRYPLAANKPTLSDLQKKILNPDQTLLHFSIGEQSIFIFVITTDFFQLLEVRYDFPLVEWIKKMKKGLLGITFENDDHFKETALEDYIEAGYAIYEKLLAPVEKHLRQRIIISPDGPLIELPFEAILVQKPNAVNKWRFHTYEYFGQTQNSIVYCYSTAMLNTPRASYPIDGNKFLVYAPYFSGETHPSVRQGLNNEIHNSCFSKLKHTADGARMINAMVGGRAVIGLEATKTAWLQEAPHYSFLHLSTHAKADPRQGELSYLAFSKTNIDEDNGYLYARDIYALRLNAELVVLSACETGIGEYVSGEGMISLANAFIHAGAKNVVTTLWSIDDEKTMKLMILFYENLSKGMTKGCALAQAKRDYLKTHKGNDAQPYYWAGVVGIGVMN
jgi:CHAT domain-containing protein